MSGGDLAAEFSAGRAPDAEFAELTFDVCMQLVHGAGPAMPASDRERLVVLATAAVRMLSAAPPAPAAAAVANAILRRPAVWRYA